MKKVWLVIAVLVFTGCSEHKVTINQDILKTYRGYK